MLSKKNLLNHSLALLSICIAIETHADSGNSSTPNTSAPQTESQAPQEIREIEIRVHPIFDESNPKENNPLFRLANRLHIETKPSVIAKDLLVNKGDAADSKKLAESERILRTRRYLNRATVQSEQSDDGSTKVTVDAYQVWTLVPSLSFSHAGGNTSSSVGLHDANFLGYGKTLNFHRTSTAERTGEVFEYIDPNTGWHQTNLSLLYADNSDGTRKYVVFERPYFALSTPNAGGGLFEDYSQNEFFYDQGKSLNTFNHSATIKQFYYGAKIESLSDDDNIHRWNIGHSERQDLFTTIPEDTSEFPLPLDREFHTTWIEYQYLQDGFIEANNIQQINRVEDINLGLELRLRLGKALSHSSNYDNSYLVNASITQGLAWSKAHLLLATLNTNGLYSGSASYNRVTTGRVDYHWKNGPRRQFFASLQGAKGQNLFADQAFILGGETGLRGYPANYEVGDKHYLLSLEQRFYGQKEWFSLFHMGYAVFYDQGRAWGNSPIAQSQQGSLRDLGIGLRISGTRNGNKEEGTHNVLHIDLATPLDGSNDISKVQWLVKVKQSF